MLSKDSAICIRVIDYSETSQIATFFARQTGKLDVIAKGSKRPKSSFDGPLQMFSAGQVVFTVTIDDKLSTLTEFQQKLVFTNLPKNLYAINCALFAAELINNLTDHHDPHPELFDTFYHFLENIADSKQNNNTLALLIIFQLSLLSEVGLTPVLNACVNCKSPLEKYSARTFFSSSENGLICQDCEPAFPDKIKLTSQAATALTNLNQIPQAKEQTLNEIEKLLINHLTEKLHKPPKMAKYIIKG